MVGTNIRAQQQECLAEASQSEHRGERNDQPIGQAKFLQLGRREWRTHWLGGRTIRLVNTKHDQCE
jgi:hypothetical protein